MAIGYLDIPYKELYKAWERVQETDRERICKVVPRARFNIQEDGSIVFSGLICSPADMHGEATGISAEWCKNCVLDKRPVKEQLKRLKELKDDN